LRLWRSVAAGGFERLLRSRPMVWLGGISYEIFLLHVLVMGLLPGVALRRPPFTGSLSGLYAMTLLVTIPLALMLRRLTDPRRRRRDPPTGHGLSRNEFCSDGYHLPQVCQ
jgi:peptidoglycan/LPS O-acetylase OafA/YrhL